MKWYNLILGIIFVWSCGAEEEEAATVTPRDSMPGLPDPVYLYGGPINVFRENDYGYDKDIELDAMQRAYPLLAPDMLFLDKEWKDVTRVTEIISADSFIYRESTDQLIVPQKPND